VEYAHLDQNDKKTQFDSEHARDAFYAGEYDVELRSITTIPESNDNNFFIPVIDKIGFLPHETFLSNGKQRTHREFFCLNRWSRTGQPYIVLPEQVSKLDEIVFPGSIIDFESVPIKFVPLKCLETWLSSRGVSINSNCSRDEIVVQVHKIIS
jgi:hypothetical protein